MNAYEKRPIEECFEKTKKPPIKVRWVDHNKGDRQNVNVRSRLVTKQIKTVKEEGLFAATPPLSEFADASISDGHWTQVQGVDVQ